MNFRSVMTLAAFCACLAPAVAATGLTFTLADLQTTQTPPQVFVRDARAKAERDDHGNVTRAAGYRGVQPDDDGGTELYTAAGYPMLVTVDKWRSASGTADVTADGSGTGDRVALSLRRLIAFGHYSVFTRIVASNGATFDPLDGSGIANNFDARQDGSASVVIVTPEHLGSGTAIVVMYHSDSQDHGDAPGEFGLISHQQLLVRVP